MARRERLVRRGLEVDPEDDLEGPRLDEAVREATGSAEQVGDPQSHDRA